VITDEIRAKIEAGTAVLWCAHAGFRGYGSSSPECHRLASRTAVFYNESRRMRRDLRELIDRRLAGLAGRESVEYSPCRGLPEVYVWPDVDIISNDPGAWSEIIAAGEPVGVHLIEGPH